MLIHQLKVLAAPGRASLCSKLIASSQLSTRNTFATEATREDYGHCKYRDIGQYCQILQQLFYNTIRIADPDTLETAIGKEKKVMLARLAGDDVSAFLFE